jgi:tape measure domain-containing protein
MAKGITSGGGLKYKAQLDITEAIKNVQSLKKELRDIGITTSGSFDTKPITGYQQAQIGLRKALADAQVETERLRQEQQRYRNELELGKVAQQANKTELDRLRAAEQALKNDLQQGKIAQQQYRTEIERNKVAQQQLTATLAQGKIEQQNLRTEITRMTLARKQEVEAARAARRAAQEVSGSYNEAQKKLRDLGNEIKGAENGFKKLTPELRKKIKEYNELNDALKRFDAQMGNHQRNVGNYRGALRSAGEDLLGFASAYLSIGNALTYVFNQTLAFQRIRTPLTFILGSEGEADNKLAELKKFANDIGVEYFSIANSYKQFTAAARASNFDLDKSEKIFKSVAKAGAVLGLSNDTLQGTFLALQQMISKGTVQSEELRGQLSERLPGAFSLAAKAMGVTEQELGKLLKAGEVTANEMLPKLAEELDKAYGDKAGESIGGLNAELNRLYASLQALAGEGSFLSKNLFEPIIIGARETVRELNQMFRGSFGENIKYFFTFKSSDLANQRLAYDLRDSRKNNQNAQDAAEQYKTEGQSLADLRTKYSQLTETLRNAYDSRAKFIKGVKDGTLKETKDATIGNYTAIANGLNAQRRRIADAIVDAKRMQTSANKEALDSELTSITAIRKRIADLNKLPGSAIEGSDIDKRIKALQERLKKGGDKSIQTELNAQRTLQAEIDALTNKGRAKQLSDDAQELSDVDAKYKKLREKAIAFNNNPKNKGLRVDIGGLLGAQTKEEDALRDKQNAATLKTTIDKEKKYYEEFEKFKSDFGFEKAKERYGKLINVDFSYLENLKAKQVALLGDDKAKGGDAGGGELVARQQKVLEEATAEALQEEQKRTDALLKEFMSYADKRKNLTEQYNSDIKDLEANPAAQAERKKRYEKDIKELDSANATQLESYEKLFEGIEKLSTRSALRLVQTARKQLADQIKSGAIVDPEQIKKINELFDVVEQTIKEKNGQALRELASEVNNVASEVGALNAEFGKVLSTVGSVVGKIGEIKGFKEILGKESSSNFQKLTAGLGIFGAGLNIFQSVVGFFNKSAQREAQESYNRDLQNKQTEALNKALERQVALLNDVYGTDRIKDYSAAIKQAQENQAKYASDLASKYALTGNKELDDLITKINNGEQVQFGVLNSDIIKKNQAQFDSLKLPSDINTLQRLLDEGKLDANTATIVNNLIKAKETAEQLVNNLRAENVGTTLDQVAEDFISTLTDGTQDFGKTFEATMQKSILNGFKGELIRKQLQAFYTQFATLSEGGLTSDEIETLRKSYLAASEKAKKDLEDLSKATGIDLTSKAGEGNSTKGQLTSASQESVTILSGNLSGMRLAQLRTNTILLENVSGGRSIGDLYTIATQKLSNLILIEQNTRRTANNTDLLNSKLDTIAKNTAGSNYNSQLSAGGQKVP